MKTILDSLGSMKSFGDALTTVIREDGTGGISFGDEAIIRGPGSSLNDPQGLFIYLRDLKESTFWSAGAQPVVPKGDPASDYEFRAFSSGAIISRTEHAIHSEMRVFVLKELPVDIRLLQITNLSETMRTIEVTSYAELVLQRSAAFHAHPAFSKLFLETDYIAATRQLVARRRSRGPDDRTARAAMWIVHDPNAEDSDLQYETDRVRFLGRGRTVACPQALTSDAPFLGTVGGVLDPIFALRTIRTIAPGETRYVAIACAAAFELPELLELAELVVFDQVLSESQSVLGANSVARTNLSDRNGGESIAPTGELRTAARYHAYCLQAIGQAEPQPFDTSLLFPNHLGGFRSDGREYVMELRSDASGELQLPPRPWSHIVANPCCGFIATERGAICSWAFNSRENRLTPWSNDPISDPCHEQVYLREAATKSFWSPLPGLLNDGCATTVRYGFGYASYERTCNGLLHQTTAFVAVDDPVRLLQITLTNSTDTERRLELLTYHPWVLGSGHDSAESGVETRWDPDRNAVLASRPDHSSYGQYCAFSTVVVEGPDRAVEFTTDAERFLGATGRDRVPLAVQSDITLGGEVGTPRHPCAALRVSLIVPPHGTVRAWQILGQADSLSSAEKLLDRYADPSALTWQFESEADCWDKLLGKLQVETPSPALNVMLNGWLVYQNIVCRLWARSSYYQGGGAFGFRDQLQDACALRYHRPDWTRQQILLHAEHQFAAGDVLHWWHPDDGLGLRTRFSDDLLWLPFTTLEYVETTGDDAIWNEPVAFCIGEDLAPGEQERLIQTRVSEEKASLYDHCCLAFERSRIVGEHGLPLIGCGDWNDGFSRVGAEGRGESVWLAFFLCHLLPRFARICQARGDEARSVRYLAWHAELLTAIEAHGWDGHWYRRAYLDNGEPLGSDSNDECRIDALVQAWAVLSGVATGDRANAIVQQVRQHLVDEPAGIIRLLTPAFDSELRDVGYIRGYIAGVRENGGQYTHGVLWFIRALAELGRGDDAVRLLEMITPVMHTSSVDRVSVYGAEPYVVAADIYGEPPHTGKAGWSWYTGSAGWMYRVAIESILGFQMIEGKWLRLKPCLPKSWPEYRLGYSLPDGSAQYEIHVRESNEAGALLDGESIDTSDGVTIVPIQRDGRVHRVEICWTAPC